MTNLIGEKKNEDIEKKAEQLRDVIVYTLDLWKRMEFDADTGLTRGDEREFSDLREMFFYLRTRNPGLFFEHTCGGILGCLCELGPLHHFFTAIDKMRQALNRFEREIRVAEESAKKSPQ